jgi:hypothetical protein
MRPIAMLTLCLTVLALVAGPADAGRWHRHGGNHHVEGSGEFETRSFDLDDFDSIRIDGVFEIEVVAGEDFDVKVEAEDNLFEYILLDARRGELRLDIEDDVDIETDEKILVMIRMPALVEIDGRGVYDLRATGLDNETTTIHSEGVGEITLEGRTRDLRVDQDGVGHADLRDLVAENADVRVQGIGDVYVFVEQELRARVSGLGEIRYAGDPASVDDHVEGFGSIEPAD